MSSPFLVSFLISILALPFLVLSRVSVLSNTALPNDTAGVPVLTGELSLLSVPPLVYYYVNDWGGCAGVDCCPSSGGCASCCFSPPSPQYPDPCVYTGNHSVFLYSTADFSSWRPLGAVLSPSNRLAGIEFRPQVVYNKATRKFVLWYEDRWLNGTSNPGYAVATADGAAGPFTTVNPSTVLAGKGRVGDYDLFVDDDGAAFHVRTGLVIARLDANYTRGTGDVYELSSPNVEGPAMFKRKGVYYLLVGVGCCACRGGSNVIVYTALRPMGPYTLQADVGSNKTQTFDKHSPLNYVTHAQQSKVIEVTAADGMAQYLWVGNQWVTSRTPGRERNADLLYWALLSFAADGNITQMEWQDSVKLSIPDVVRTAALYE
jgi:hypothetical protein